MQFAVSLFIAALSLAPRVLAGTGGVALYNGCDFPVYGTTITLDGLQATSTVQPGQWHWEPYQRPSRGGTSIKLSKTNAGGAGPITQLEYTLTGDGMIWYDLSNVDCGPTSSSDKGECPFLHGGMHLKNDAAECPTRSCNDGDEKCHDAYNLFNDDWATAGCNHGGQNTVMFMCKSSAVA